MSALASLARTRAELPRILCVDDEPHILDSLQDTLHRHFEVVTATGGPEALALLQEEPAAYAVVMSDMRMPVMTGSEFLRAARECAPDATRILLTGYADLDAAVSAVNDGQLFRFLTKPCQVDDLVATCDAAVEQNRLRTAERVLLEQTLKGSVKALTDVLALANPAAFGRSARVRDFAGRLAMALTHTEPWEVEVAAMLAQVGAVTLPPETAEKLYEGQTLTPGEQDMVRRVPELTKRILGNIPRLGGVIEILDNYQRSYAARGAGRSLPLGARILRIAIDFDQLTAHGGDAGIALAAMRGRDALYDPDLLDVFAEVIGGESETRRVTQIPVLGLRAGMLLADDVRSSNGGLLIARGHRATEQLITRLWNLREGSVREPLLVLED